MANHEALTVTHSEPFVQLALGAACKEASPPQKLATAQFQKTILRWLLTRIILLLFI